MERSRFHAVECKGIPSSFVAHCKGRERPVTIVANGTQFVYILDSCNLKYLGSIRFPSGVQYVSCLQSLPPVALCCLRDGRIFATPIEELIANVSSVSAEAAAKPSKEKDVFAALLEEDGNTEEEEGACGRRRGLVKGEDVSLLLAASHNPGWSIQCAAVYANLLLLFATVKSTGEKILAISMSAACVDVGDCSIPVFGHDLPAVQCTLSSQRCSATGCQSTNTSQPTSVLKYQPAFAIAHCRQRIDSVCSVSTLLPLQEGLYLQLFGPECKLANSPVLLTGSQDGHIFYCDLNALRGPGENRQPLHLLYSLEQPVVVMHAVNLPTKVTHDDPLLVESDERKIPEMNANANAMIFVGQKGKVVVCTVGGPDQRVANFTEFNVPGPILSSVLIPDQCLLYSTLNTVFEICLKPMCVRNSKGVTAGSSASPVLVPEMAFRFPNRVMSFAGFLLAMVPSCSSSSDSESKTEHGRVVSMSLKGDVCSFSVADRRGEAATMDSISAAQELKHSLTAIQVTSQQTTATKQKLSKLNASLAELNNALSLLCDVAVVQLRNRTASSRVQGTAASTEDGETTSPFHCDLSPSFDQVGVSGRRVCILVQLCYAGRKSLGAGWSLVVQLHYSNHSVVPTICSNTGVGGDTEVMSQVFPLAAMRGGSQVQLKIPVDASVLTPLRCSVSCSLHYSTPNVLTELTQSELTGTSDVHGVVFPLCSEVLDALDFLQPFQESCQELVPSEKCPQFLYKRKLTSWHQSTNPQSLLHSLELLVSPDTVARLSTAIADGAEVLPTSLCTSTLKRLLPVTQRNPEKIITRTFESDRRTSSEVKLTAHDGSAVGLKVVFCREEASAMSVVIQAGTRRRLVEVCGCVQGRLLKLEGLGSSQQPPSDVTSCSHDQLCRMYSNLQRLSSEVTSIQGELALEEEDQKLLELLSQRTYQLYCRLREID